MTGVEWVSLTPVFVVLVAMTLYNGLKDVALALAGIGLLIYISMLVRAWFYGVPLGH